MQAMTDRWVPVTRVHAHAARQGARRQVERARAVLAIALPRSLVRVALRSVQAAAALATVGVPLALIFAAVGVGLPAFALPLVADPLANVQVPNGVRLRAVPAACPDLLAARLRRRG